MKKEDTHLHAINTNESSSHTASNCSEQCSTASSTHASSQTSQRQAGCCSKYISWCRCQHCVDYYILTAFFLFYTLTLSLVKYIWIFVSSSIGCLWSPIRDSFFEKPKVERKSKRGNYCYCYFNIWKIQLHSSILGNASEWMINFRCLVNFTVRLNWLVFLRFYVHSFF